MKNCNKTDSPKTPGGISKSHLTPIRRLGLSRNWRKSGTSPFISPLSGSNTIANDTNRTSVKENRKRKEPVENENLDIESKTSEDNVVPDGTEDIHESDIVSSGNKTEHIVATPTRTVSLPRKKKSKILKSNSGVESDNIPDKSSEISPKIDSKNKTENTLPLKSKVEIVDGSDDIIEKYVEVKTKSKPRKSTKKKEKEDDFVDNSEIKAQVHVDASSIENDESDISTTTKQKSPKELTKECIVVIQKKIFKNELKNELHIDNKKQATSSQILFDSDSEDVPLNQLQTKNSAEVKQNLDTIDEDFIEPTVKVKMLKSKTTSTTGLKISNCKKKNSKISKQIEKPKGNIKIDIKNTQTHEESFDDDDDDEDFQMDNKRTILIRKSYDKVSKLSRARSTGSITQKDIDDLKARIEMKKKLLMAKSINKDTEELRELIKKWQKGCQDALAELMDLMKLQFPDKRNMDYSEILETLKIPAHLVGYDSDNDCFVTPTDENIVLAKLNDLL